MEIKFQTVACCTDGIGGKLSHILIDQRSWKMAFLVVKGCLRGDGDWLVPFSILESSRNNEVRLNCSTDRLRQFEAFTVFDFPSESLEEKASQGLGPNPYAMLAASVQQAYQHSVPPGCLPLYWGTQVQAVDRQVWRLGAVGVEPRHQALSSLVLYRGRGWFKKEFVVPAHHIEHMEPEIITLDVDHQQVEAHPTYHRPWHPLTRS